MTKRKQSDEGELDLSIDVLLATAVHNRAHSMDA